MPKLVLLNDDGQIAQVFEENITEKQFDEIIQDYYRLLSLEESFRFNSEIVKSNEQKLHLLFGMLQDTGALKNNRISMYPMLKPYFDDFIDEYELRKKLDKKLRNKLEESSNLLGQKMRSFFWSMLAKGAKLLGKKLTK
jgi:hypothetical protein